MILADLVPGMCLVQTADVRSVTTCTIGDCWVVSEYMPSVYHDTGVVKMIHMRGDPYWFTGSYALERFKLME